MAECNHSKFIQMYTNHKRNRTNLLLYVYNCNKSGSKCSKYYLIITQTIGPSHIDTLIFINLTISCYLCVKLIFPILLNQEKTWENLLCKATSLIWLMFTHLVFIGQSSFYQCRAWLNIVAASYQLFNMTCAWPKVVICVSCMAAAL